MSGTDSRAQPEQCSPGSTVPPPEPLTDPVLVALPVPPVELDDVELEELPPAPPLPEASSLQPAMANAPASTPYTANEWTDLILTPP
ncbi:hypothetical protein BE15_36810 [Sorangium cellulosum]|uniref:Uncharacterized protein n=1 Tax=Sorangium cellulosum TaxID=56 RepID=A0A150QGT2_SORCE|nr:hypothetical protein BE15_36810 [Sorangium cellulosum]